MGHVLPLGIFLNAVVEPCSPQREIHKYIAVWASVPVRVGVALQDAALDLLLQAVPLFARRLVRHRRLL